MVLLTGAVIGPSEYFTSCFIGRQDREVLQAAVRQLLYIIDVCSYNVSGKLL